MKSIRSCPRSVSQESMCIEEAVQGVPLLGWRVCFSGLAAPSEAVQSWTPHACMHSASQCSVCWTNKGRQCATDRLPHICKIDFMQTKLQTCL